MRIVWFLAKALFGFVALLAVLAALGMYLNARALDAASAYCHDVRPGTPRADLVAALEAAGQRYRSRSDPDQVQVLFQGWVFNAAVCTIDTHGGQAGATSVSLDGD